MNNYKFTYKRINHFIESINRYDKNHIKKHLNIPKDTIETIKEHLKTGRMKANNYNVKHILKHLKLNKYYEYIPWIAANINDEIEVPKNRLRN